MLSFKSHCLVLFFHKTSLISLFCSHISSALAQIWPSFICSIFESKCELIRSRASRAISLKWRCKRLRKEVISFALFHEPLLFMVAMLNILYRPWWERNSPASFGCLSFLTKLKISASRLSCSAYFEKTFSDGYVLFSAFFASLLRAVLSRMDTG